MAGTLQQAEIRLAIREEGQNVNAYLASMAGMDDAILIGSIRKALLRMRPELFEQFKALMTSAMTTLIEVGGAGKVLSYNEEPAPEHERAGHA